MRSLRRFLHLGAADRRLVLLILWRTVYVRLGLSCLRFGSWQKLFIDDSPAIEPHQGEPGSGGSFETEATDRARLARVQWAVQAVGHRVPGATCLVQAIVARRTLRDLGYVSNLQLGVARTNNGRLQAHAWVECLGTVVIGDVPGDGVHWKFQHLHTMESPETRQKEPE